MDLEKPLFDQTTFIGRLKHFFWVTDPRTCVCSEDTLDNAKTLITEYRYISVYCLSHIVSLMFCLHTFRQIKEPQGTTDEQIIFARKLYESAFHPDTGEKQNVFGRMSFQVPGGMAITGFMLQFYR